MNIPLKLCKDVNQNKLSFYVAGISRNDNIFSLRRNKTWYSVFRGIRKAVARYSPLHFRVDWEMKKYTTRRLLVITAKL